MATGLHLPGPPPPAHGRRGGRRLSAQPGPKQHHTRPAVDPLFVSAARVWGPRIVGVVLTGMGDDGVRGLIAVSGAGGIAVVQSPSEAPHPSMPRNAIARDHVGAAILVSAMPGVLAALAAGRPVQVGAACGCLTGRVQKGQYLLHTAVRFSASHASAVGPMGLQIP